MPRYSYECDKCGHNVEEFRKVDDRDKTFKCGMLIDKKPCKGTYRKTASLTAPPKIQGGTPRFYR